jgi:hypothetical protein
MNVNFMPFAVLGATLVLVVLGMVVWRQTVARREDDTLHVLHGTAVIPDQTNLAHKLDIIDKWGKILTVITAVYVLVVGGLYVYQQWVTASTTIVGG